MRALCLRMFAYPREEMRISCAANTSVTKRVRGFQGAAKRRR